MCFPTTFLNRMVESENITDEINIQVINSVGQKLLEIESKTPININSSDWIPGIYYLKIKRGADYEIRKIIKVD